MRHVGRLKMMHLYYIVRDEESSDEVLFEAGPYFDLETALDACVELAYLKNLKNLEVYKQEVVVGQCNQK